MNNEKVRWKFILLMNMKKQIWKNQKDVTLRIDNVFIWKNFKA